MRCSCGKWEAGLGRSPDESVEAFGGVERCVGRLG